MYEGDGGSGAGYTAVFTGLLDSKKAGEYPYMLLKGESAGEGTVHRGKPPGELVRHEITYEELPEDVRRRVVEAYRDMWSL